MRMYIWMLIFYVAGFFCGVTVMTLLNARKGDRDDDRE